MEAGAWGLADPELRSHFPSFLEQEPVLENVNEVIKEVARRERWESREKMQAELQAEWRGLGELFNEEEDFTSLGGEGEGGGRLLGSG